MDKSLMDSRRALNLALAIYRVTDKLPAAEILVKQLRESGNEVVGDFEIGEKRLAIKKIERLLIYIEIARGQDWIKPENWHILAQEYELLKNEISQSKKEGGEDKKTKTGYVSHNIRKTRKLKKSEKTESKLNGRQEKIIATLKDKKLVKMSELSSLFKNEATDRTLRNDLKELITEGLIKKNGFNKSAFYSVR